MVGDGLPPLQLRLRTVVAAVTQGEAHRAKIQGHKKHRHRVFDLAARTCARSLFLFPEPVDEIGKFVSEGQVEPGLDGARVELKQQSALLVLDSRDQSLIVECQVRLWRTLLRGREAEIEVAARVPAHRAERLNVRQAQHAALSRGLVRGLVPQEISLVGEDQKEDVAELAVANLPAVRDADRRYTGFARAGAYRPARSNQGRCAG